MELAVWGAEVAAVHAPQRARAARSTAAMGKVAEAEQGRARTGKACRCASRAAAPGCPDQRRGDHHGRGPRRGGGHARAGTGQPSLTAQRDPKKLILADATKIMWGGRNLRAWQAGPYVGKGSPAVWQVRPLGRRQVMMPG